MVWPSREIPELLAGVDRDSIAIEIAPTRIPVGAALAAMLLAGAGRQGIAIGIAPTKC